MVLAAPVHWRAGLAALLLGLVSVALSHRQRLTAGLLALGAAPLWLAAADSHPGGLLLVLTAPLLLLHRSGLPAAVPWLILAVAGVEAGRLWLVVPALDGAAALAVPVLLGGAAVAASAAAPPTRLASGALVLSGSLLCAGSGLALRGPAQTAEAVQAASEWGVLRYQPLPPASLRPEAITADPTWHAVAMSIPLDAALEAGWRPAGAPLEPADRIAAARQLERTGRGGEGWRLLYGRREPALQWWQSLFARLHGHPKPWSGGAAPAEALTLPDEHDLGLVLAQTGTTEILLHATSDLRLTLTLSGEWYEGPPELEVVLDDAAQTIQVSRTRRLHDLGSLSAGPHRLLLRFLNDLQGQTGDRNIIVHSLVGE